MGSVSAFPVAAPLSTDADLLDALVATESALVALLAASPLAAGAVRVAGQKLEALTLGPVTTAVVAALVELDGADAGMFFGALPSEAPEWAASIRGTLDKVRTGIRHVSGEATTVAVAAASPDSDRETRIARLCAKIVEYHAARAQRVQVGQGHSMLVHREELERELAALLADGSVPGTAEGRTD